MLGRAEASYEGLSGKAQKTSVRVVMEIYVGAFSCDLELSSLFGTERETNV